MRTKSDTQVTLEYDDLADGDTGTTRVLRALDAGYGSAPLPPSLRELKLPVRPAGKPSRVGVWRKRWKISAPIAVLGAVAVVVAGSLAAGKSPSITDLGKPTNAYGATGYNVLDNFHKIKQNLQVGKKPEFLLVNEVNNFPPGEAIRWPVIKALDQFGKLSGVKAIEAWTTPVGSSCLRRVDGLYTPCDLATFDLTHARYTSRYLTFVNRDVFVYGGRTGDGKKWKLHPGQRLDGEALKLFNRHVQLKQRLPSDPAEIAHLPMLVIGNYLETSSSFVSGSELTGTIAGAPTYCPSSGCLPMSQARPLSFNTVRESLVHDKNPAGNTTLLLDVNAEANVLTALICHADGKKPASVCGRPVIKKLMKLAK